MRELAKSRLYLHRPCSMMLSFFEIEGGPDPERVKRAIARAMGRHEQLKSKITLKHDGEAYYEPIPKPEVRVAIETYEPPESDDEESLLDIAFERAEEMVQLNLDLSSGELMRHLILSDGEMTVWVIASHYLAGDAYSMQYLAGDVFRILDEPETKLEEIPWYDASEGVPGSEVLSWPSKKRVSRLNKIWKREGKAFDWNDLKRMQTNFHEAWPLHVFQKSFEPAFTRAMQELVRRENLHFFSPFAAAFAKASAERDHVSLLVSTRPEGYEGVGTYQGGVSLPMPKGRTEDLLELARSFSETADQEMKLPEKLHHSAVVLYGIDETLIDAGYYSAYDALKSKAAMAMAQIYGFRQSGSGMQLSNLKVTPIPCAYGFGSLKRIFLLPPMAPNFARSISLATAGENLGMMVSSYGDRAYENFLTEKTEEILRSFLESQGLL